jgi:hypothetical protein
MLANCCSLPARSSWLLVLVDYQQFVAVSSHIIDAKKASNEVLSIFPNTEEAFAMRPH